MKKIFKALIIFIALGFGFMLTLGASENAKMEDREVISAQKLYDFYEDNVVKGNKRFKGKYIEVYGEIQDIYVDIFGCPIVVLDCGFMKVDAVQCSFKEKEVDKLTDFKKGDKIRLVGKCAGKVFNVEIQRCEVME